MPQIRALFDIRYEDRRACCCADSESQLTILTFRKRTHVDSFFTRDFLFGIGHAHSFLMEGRSLEEMGRQAEEAAPLEKVATVVSELVPGMVRLDFTAHSKLLFTKHLAGELDAQMMAESYLDALRGWSLAKRAPKIRGAVPLLVRVRGNRRAEILRLLPDTGHSGLILRIYQNESLIFTRFRRLLPALEQANVLVPGKGGTGDLTMPEEDLPLFGPTLEVPLVEDVDVAIPDPDPELQTGYTYDQGEIRTAVIREPNANPAGFSVLVRVADRAITRVLGDLDQGAFALPLPRAIKKAQDLARALQGWSLPDQSSR